MITKSRKNRKEEKAEARFKKAASAMDELTAAMLKENAAAMERITQGGKDVQQNAFMRLADEVCLRRYESRV